MRRCLSTGLVLLFAMTVARAENWPGYEGLRHQSSSPIEVSGVLGVKWENSYTNLSYIPVATTWGITGYMHSRNLAYFNGMIAVAINSDPAYPDYPTRLAPLTILNASDGAEINCVTTSQYNGGYKNMWDAIETGLGEQIVTWDPDTGIVFLSIGGDMPGHSAILPLANAATFSGTYQNGIGAYEDMNNQFPNLASSRNKIRSLEPSIHSATPPMPTNEWDSQNSFPNRCGFFDCQPGSPYIVVNKGSGHEDAQADDITNKFTGLCAKENWDQYTYADTGFPIFKMWNGQLVDGDKIYYLGPYEVGATASQLCDSTLGMQVACMQMIPADNYANGGYTGPGAAETAHPNPVKLFQYQYTSPVADGDAWMENDNNYRNKAWLVQGDGVWIAWKPSTNSTVKLVRATPTVNQTYDLGIGTGLLAQDMWANIAYQDLGASGQYIVYYLANAYSGTEGASAAPRGPASLVVFNVGTQTVKWTYQLNNSAGTGNYPDLPPNPNVLYFECSRMVVAGKYACLAWVDTSGTIDSNAWLKVIRFDITSASAPATPPVPFQYNLGIPAASNKGARVNDLIAVSGSLYVSVVEATAVSRYNFIDNQAQRIIAIRPTAQSDIDVALSVTPATGAARVVAVCDATGSTTTAASITSYEWDFDYDQITFVPDATGAKTSCVFGTVGRHQVAVKVTDDTGHFEVRSTVVEVTPDVAAPQSVTFPVTEEVCIRQDNDKTRMWVSGTYGGQYSTGEHSRGYVNFASISLNPAYIIQEARLNFSINRTNNDGSSTEHRLKPAETLSASSTWAQISAVVGYDQDGSTSNGVNAPLSGFSLTNLYTGPKYFVVTDAVLAWLGRAPYSIPEAQKGFLLCVDDNLVKGTLETAGGYTTFYVGEKDSHQWGFTAGATNLEIIYVDPAASTPQTISGVMPGATVGESYSNTSPLNIFWGSTGPVTNVDIQYSTTSATGPWTNIATNQANDGSYSWASPVVSNTIWIKVVKTGSATPNAVSANSFAVTLAGPDLTPPVVTLSACDLTGTCTDANPPAVITVGGTDVPLSGVNWSRTSVPFTKGVDIPISATDVSGNTRVVNVNINW